MFDRLIQDEIVNDSHIKDVDGLSETERTRLRRWRKDSLEKLKLARKELDAVMRSLTAAKSTFELRYQR